MAEFTGINLDPMPNVLYDPLRARMAGAELQSQQIQNQFAPALNQQRLDIGTQGLQKGQQELGLGEQEQIGRAANAVLSLDPADRPAAYKGLVTHLQSLGFARNAPAEYPGDTAMHGYAAMAVPAIEQYKFGLSDTGNRIVLGQNGQPGGTGGRTPAPPGAYGAGGPGANIKVPDAYMPFYQEASQRTGIPVDVLIAQHRQESGFNPNAIGRAGEIGIGQVMPSTAMAPGYGQAPIDPSQLRDPRTNINFSADYLKARMPPGANPADPETIRRALHAYNGGGDPNYVANVTRYMPAGAGSAPVQQAAAAPPAPSGVAARTGGVDVAGPGAGPASGLPMALTDTPANAPATPSGAPAPQPVGNLGLVRDPNTGNVGTPQPTVPAVPGANQAIVGAPMAGVASPQNTLAPPPAPTAAPSTPAGVQPQQPPQLGWNADARGNVFQTQDGQFTQQQAREIAAAVVTRQPVTPLIEKFRADNLAQQKAAFEQAHPTTSTRFAEGGAVWTGNGWRMATPNDPPETVVAGRWGQQGDRSTGFIPGQPQPSGAAYEAQKSAYKTDQDRMPSIAVSAQNAQAGMLRLNELASIIPQLASGPAGALRERGAEWLEQMGASPETIKRYTGMASGSLAEELVKLSVATVGQAAKADLGSNVGIQSLQLYQSANPGMALLPDANKRMTNMARVGAQMTADFAQGAQDHFNSNQQTFLQGKGYKEPLSQYEADWQRQNTPQIGSAAMGILNGDDFNKWGARANDQQRAAAIGLVSRIDPNAMIPLKDGRLVPVQDVMARLPKPGPLPKAGQ